jgi:hypothetical protein
MQDAWLVAVWIDDWIGPKEHFDGEGGRAGDRVGIDDESVVAVEHQPVAEGRADHGGAADDRRHGVAADGGRVVNVPGDLGGRRIADKKRQCSRGDDASRKLVYICPQIAQMSADIFKRAFSRRRHGVFHLRTSATSADNLRGIAYLVLRS